MMNDKLYLLLELEYFSKSKHNLIIKRPKYNSIAHQMLIITSDNSSYENCFFRKRKGLCRNHSKATHNITKCSKASKIIVIG